MDLSITPRKYQEELLKHCIDCNTILYLPTGSGKTYIAVMFIKEMMRESYVKHGRGKKLAVFAVNQVTLAQQQADYISRHAGLKVACYIGIMNVDTWNKTKWRTEFKENEVLVMTVQILCNIIVHNIIDVNNICVAVFDECHAATGNHPMKLAVDNIHRLHTKPRLLGLSGSLLNGDCKVSRVARSLKELEETFKSKIATPKTSLLPEVQRYSTNPDEEIHYYGPSTVDGLMKEIDTLLKQCQETIMQYKIPGASTSLTKPPLGFVLLTDDMKENKELKNIIENVRYQLGDLGLYGGYEATNMYIIALDKLGRRANTADTLDLITAIKETLCEVRGSMERQMKIITEPSERVRVFSSKKFTGFVSLIEKIFEDISKNSPSSADKQEHTILVFVKRRASARTLSSMLKVLSLSNHKLSAMKTDCFVGYGAQQSNEVTEMHRATNEAAIERFRKKETNLLVSTDALEEGIDIPMCNTVIMFDPPNSCRSYVQSKGRARHKTSIYHIFVSENDTNFLKKFTNYRAIGNEISRILRPGATSMNAVEADMLNETQEEIVVWHMPHGSHATMSGSHAIQLVNMYCAKLPQDRFTHLAPLWYIINREGKCVCYVQLPMNSKLKSGIEGKPQNSKKLAKQSAAVETVKKLYIYGELDDNLVPKPLENIVQLEKLFPYLRKESVEQGPAQQGSKKRKQLYVKRCPIMFSYCQPQEAQETYLYVIKLETAYTRPCTETDSMIFYEMFNNDEHFGILSSKEIPQIFRFPLYTAEGQLNVTLLKNCESYMLNKEQIQCCEEFHQLAFYKILNIVKPFMTVDCDRRDHSYILVPVKTLKEGNWSIDWKSITETGKFFSNTETEKRKSRERLKCSRFSVLTAQHALEIKQLYLVSAVYEDDTYAQNTNKGFVAQNLGKTTATTIVIPNELNCTRNKQEQQKKKKKEYKKSIVNLELFDVFPLPASLCLKIHLLPTFLHKLTVLAGAYEICEKFPVSRRTLHLNTHVVGLEYAHNHDIQLLSRNNSSSHPELNDVEQALTAASSDNAFNSETLETLGDSFLKFAVGLFLFIHFNNHHEGILSSIKAKVVGNSHFYNIAKAKDFGSKLQVHRFSPEDSWMPPGFCIPQQVCRKLLQDHISPEFLKDLKLTQKEQMSDDINAALIKELTGKENTWSLNKTNNNELLIGVQTVSDKALADSVEALTGVYLKAFGVCGAVELLNSLGILPRKEASPDILFSKPLDTPVLHDSMSSEYVNYHLGNVEDLEKTLNYRFKDRGFLLQALTHPSFTDNRITDYYQRLEFLGDAILDFLVTSYIYEKCEALSPGKLTLLRAALVNNSTFAAFSVKCGLHKHCKYLSSELFYNIDEFVRFQEENNHEITDELMYYDDDANRITKPVAVPKVIGDLFESVAAAIYLDSGKCLKTVWSTYYKIMEKELVKYCK